MIEPDPLVALRLQRGVENLLRLGPWANARQLSAAGAHTRSMPITLWSLAEYQRFTPAMIRADRHNSFVVRTLLLVPGDGDEC